MNKPLADLFIRQTFFHQTFEKSKFAKHSPRQTFPLYGINFSVFKGTVSYHRAVRIVLRSYDFFRYITYYNNQKT